MRRVLLFVRQLESRLYLCFGFVCAFYIKLTNIQGVGDRISKDDLEKGVRIQLKPAFFAEPLPVPLSSPQGGEGVEWVGKAPKAL